MRKPVRALSAEFSGNAVILQWRIFSTPGIQYAKRAEFTILRKEEHDFIFGQDYQEFFLNSTPNGAKALFTGSFDSVDGVNFSYEDCEVEYRKTYSYFIKKEGSEPIGPIPIRVRDPKIWWPYEKVNKSLDDLVRRYPKLVKIEVAPLG